MIRDAKTLLMTGYIRALLVKGRFAELFRVCSAKLATKQLSGQSLR